MQSVNDEQELRDIQQGLARAWRQRDRAFIETVLASEWSVTQPDGPPPVDLHTRVAEVAVGLVRERRHPLVVVRAAQALVVPGRGRGHERSPDQ